MRRVVPPKIKFIYLDEPESYKRLEMAYNRIFTIAKQNILKRKQLMKINEVDTKDTHKSSLLDTNNISMYTKV